MIALLSPAAQRECLSVEKRMIRAVFNNTPSLWAEVVVSRDGTFHPNLPAFTHPGAKTQHISFDMMQLPSSTSFGVLEYLQAAGVASRLITAAAPHLRGLTSLNLRGSIEAIELVMATLKGGRALSCVTRMQIVAVRPHGVLHVSQSACVDSLVDILGTMQALRTLDMEGVRTTFAALSSALAHIPLTSLTTEVVDWDGILIMSHLHQLHLVCHTGSAAMQSAVSKECFSKASFPQLTHFTLSHGTVDYAGTWEPAPDNDIHHTCVNSFLETFLQLTPQLQSLVVNNLNNRQRSLLLSDSAHRVLARLPNLQHLTIGCFMAELLTDSRQLELNSLTELKCDLLLGEEVMHIVPNISCIHFNRIQEFMLCFADHLGQILNYMPPQITTVNIPDTCLVDARSFDSLSILTDAMPYVKHLLIRVISGCLPKSFEEMACMESFGLAGCHLRQVVGDTHVSLYLSELRRAQCLTSLHLLYCSMNPYAPALLARLSKLTHLRLEGCCNMSKQLAEKIISEMPNLIKLEILDCVGITNTECQQIQASSRGAVGFRLVCFESL